MAELKRGWKRTLLYLVGGAALGFGLSIMYIQFGST
jgi:hypothetical protein